MPEILLLDWLFAQDAKDIVIVPRRMYRDPFRPGNNNIIVLADTYQEARQLRMKGVQLRMKGVHAL